MVKKLTEKQLTSALEALANHKSQTAAAESLGLPRPTFQHWVNEAYRAGLGTKPDAKAGPADPVAHRRLQDQAVRAENRAREAERHAVTAAALREGVFKLAAEPLRPEHWAAPKTVKAASQEAIVLFVSDIHMGEVIDLAQMGGRNSYSKAIARQRIKRYFENVVKMSTAHWSGPPPAVIYLVFGGDFISGEIHDELAKTNDLLAIPAVRELSECLVSGIDLLLASFKCDIRVVSLPGNHGRTTKKPEAKGNAINSYDTLVAWSVESWFAAKAEKRITFSAPASGDALINIMGWNVLFTHGDRIGSRGGAGFIGPAATAARGMQRLIQDYASEGVVVDFCIIGHFHTPIELEQGFVNGSFGGPSEYSRAGRMRSHPASQWMLTIHPGHGVARRWKIQLGTPDEGSIYKGRIAA